MATKIGQFTLWAALVLAVLAILAVAFAAR